MAVVVVTPPEPFVTLAEAKRHLRVDGSDDDEYIKSLVLAAQMSIDGPDGWLGRAIGIQTLEYQRDVFYDAFLLPFRPAISIVSVVYRNGVGTEVVVPADWYELRGSVLGTTFGKSWPSVGYFEDAVRVRYVAGYGKMVEVDGVPTLVNDAPAPIKQALLLLIGQWYAFRSNVAEDSAPAQLPFAVEALLSPFRIWS